MKVILFTFLATFLIVEIISVDPKELEDDVEKWIQACELELNIPKDKMEEYHSMTEPPTDEMGNCLTYCVLDKAGVMTNKKIDEEKMMEFVGTWDSEDEMKALRQVAEKCQSQANAKTAECEIAGTFSQCVFKEMKSASD